MLVPVGNPLRHQPTGVLNHLILMGHRRCSILSNVVYNSPRIMPRPRVAQSTGAWMNPDVTAQSVARTTGATFATGPPRIPESMTRGRRVTNVPVVTFSRPHRIEINTFLIRRREVPETTVPTLQ